MFSFGLLHAGLMRARRQCKTKRKQSVGSVLSFCNRLCIISVLLDFIRYLYINTSTTKVEYYLDFILTQYVHPQRG